jgi:hypothetical protein
MIVSDAREAAGPQSAYQAAPLRLAGGEANEKRVREAAGPRLASAADREAQ